MSNTAQKIEAQHTPGPWHFEEQHPKFGGFFVHHNADETQSNDDVIASDIKSEANARLIAAAPELLANLQDALRYIEVVIAYQGAMTPAEVERAILANKNTSEVLIAANSVFPLAKFNFNDARAAIAKAEGK